MILRVTEWIPVMCRGYSFMLPPGFNAVNVDGGSQELREYEAEDSPLVVGTYRWVQPLTGSFGLEATVGHVVDARTGQSVKVLASSASSRIVSFLSGPAGSVRTVAAGLRLADEDVAVVLGSHPVGALDDSAETIDRVVRSARPT